MSILDSNEIIIIVSSILVTILIIIMIKICCRNNYNSSYYNSGYKPTFHDISESLKNINIIDNEKSRLI